MRINNSKNSFFILVIIIIAAAALLVTIFGGQCGGDRLDLYNKSDIVEEMTRPTEEETTIEMQEENFSDYGFSLSIPSGWQKVTKSGYPTYIHKESGSSVQVRYLAYDPKINNDDPEYYSTVLTERGYTFLNFKELSTSSYEVIYQDKQENIYDHMDVSYWDQEHIVRLMFTCSDEDYEDILPYFSNILTSFEWYKKNEIPENIKLIYNETPAFEFAYPVEFAVGAATNSIVCSDPNTGTTISVGLLDYDKSVKDLTSIDVSSLIGNGKSGFILSSFDKSENEGIATATYMYNNIQIQSRSKFISSGDYLYVITTEYEKGLADTEVLEQCLEMFRTFPSNEIQLETSEVLR